MIKTIMGLSTHAKGAFIMGWLTESRVGVYQRRYLSFGLRFALLSFWLFLKRSLFCSVEFSELWILQCRSSSR